MIPKQQLPERLLLQRPRLGSAVIMGLGQTQRYLRTLIKPQPIEFNELCRQEAQEEGAIVAYLRN